MESPFEPGQNTDRLTIYMGPMFSGKTTAMIKDLSRFLAIGWKVLIIGHTFDVRSSQVISTHSPLISMDEVAGIESVKVKKLIGEGGFIDGDDWSPIEGYDAIGIDEAQFFDEDIIEFVKLVVEDWEKYIVVSGLNGSFKRQPMGHILSLIPLADKVDVLSSWCMKCKDKGILRRAHFSKYEGEKKVEGDVVVGGKETYSAVCRRCYLARS